MVTSVMVWVPIFGALISVAAAVVSVMAVRRGADADLRGDVHELAAMVERFSKEARRDKMRRVRAGEKVGTIDDEPMPVPPGFNPAQASLPVGTFDRKQELRRRLKGVT